MEPDKIDRTIEFILQEQARQAAQAGTHEERFKKLETGLSAMVVSQNQLIETVSGLARISHELNLRQQRTDERQQKFDERQQRMDERMELLAQHLDRLTLHVDALILRLDDNGSPNGPI